MMRNIINQLRPNKVFLNTIRFASNTEQKLIRNHHDLKMLPPDELAAFMGYFPKVVKDGIGSGILPQYPPVQKRIEKCMNYYLVSGKLLRQHMFLYIYKKIEEHYKTFKPENMEKAYQMAWCLELFSNQIIIIDDVIDNHEMRRGKPTWFKLEGIGMNALNDGYVLQFVMYQLLKKYFSDHPNYLEILHTFMKAEITIGLALEAESENFDSYTMDRCYAISQCKFAGFSYTEPLQLVTLLTNKALFMNEMTNRVWKILGYLYSVQNDMLDCYGEKLTGKPGTDIQEGKCAAPIALALNKASTDQRRILQQCYGSYDPEKLEKVYQVYEEIDIIGEYHKLEKTLVSQVSHEMKQIPNDFARSIVSQFAYAATFGQVGEPPVYS